MDTRKALKNKTILPFYNASQGICEYTIQKELSRGATCIVYDASYQNNSGNQKLVRIKECYPFALTILRRNDNTLVPSTSDRAQFEAYKQQMAQAFDLGNHLFSVSGLTNYTSNTVDIYELNNTLYVVTTYQEGETLSYQQFASLKDCVSIVKSTAKVIARIHEEGYLYLDLKPENIFTLTGTTEIVQLFDFDSLIPLSAFQNDTINQYKIAYTRGFSALELQMGNLKRISKKTDVYSIGAILFYLLFGRAPTAMDAAMDAQYAYQNTKYASKTFQDKMYDELTDFFHHTLASYHLDRYQDMTQVILKLETIEKLADTTIPYIHTTHSFYYPYMVGREQELAALDHWMQKPADPLLVVTGMGGIGKTALVQSYLAEHASQFDTILCLQFHHSLKVTLTDDQQFHINAISQNRNEDPDDYFLRKLAIARELTHNQRVVLVIDNYEAIKGQTGLKELLALNWKILLITRNAFEKEHFPVLHIEAIASQEALYALFENNLRRTIDINEYTYVDNMIDHVQGHTLVLELIAKQIAHSYLTIEEASKLLKENGLMQMAPEKITYTKDWIAHNDSIQNIINRLFFLSKEHFNQQDILKSIAYFGTLGIDVHLFSDLYGLRTKDCFNDLVMEGWITIHNYHIRMHPVIIAAICSWPLTDSFEKKTMNILLALKEHLRQEPQSLFNLCEAFLQSARQEPSLTDKEPFHALLYEVTLALPRHREDDLLTNAIWLVNQPGHLSAQAMVKLYDMISETYEEKQQLDLAYTWIKKAEPMIQKTNDEHIKGLYEYLWVGYYDNLLDGAYDAYTAEEKKRRVLMDKHLDRAIRHMKKSTHSDGKLVLAEYLRCKANIFIRSRPKHKRYIRYLLDKVKKIIAQSHQQHTILGYSYALTEAWYYTYVEADIDKVYHYIHSAFDTGFSICENDLDLIDDIYRPSANILLECHQDDLAEKLLLDAIQLCANNEEILPYVRKEIELYTYLLDVYDIMQNDELFSRTLQTILTIYEKYKDLGLKEPFQSI